MHQSAAETRETFGQALFARGKAPAHEPLSLRPERRPGREAKARLAHQALAEIQRVGHALNAKERIHGAARRGGAHAIERLQFLEQEIPRAPESLHRARDDRLAL